MFRARVSTTRRDLQKKEWRDETDRGRTQLLSTICRLDTCTLFRYHFPIQCDVHRIALRCSIIPCYSRSILSYINPSFDSYAKRIHRCIFSSASIEDGGELRLFGKRIAAPVLAGGIGRFVKRSNYASNYASSASNCYFHKCLSVNRLKFGIRPII